VSEVTSFSTFLARALATDRLLGGLVAVCGLIALGLAMVGIYGVMIDMVQRRTREIGLRMALGAGPLVIVRMVLGASGFAALAGIAPGIFASVLVNRIIRSLVYGLPRMESATIGIIIAAIFAVMILAAVPPLWRALRVSPLIVLRA
jgi:ABC-type antimicrobial peptide transport system permease subunit